MTLINEISDRGAVVAWSPNRMYADVLCVGSKVRLLTLLAGDLICLTCLICLNSYTTISISK